MNDKNHSAAAAASATTAPALTEPTISADAIARLIADRSDPDLPSRPKPKSKTKPT